MSTLLNDLTINTVLFNEEIQIAQCHNHFKYSIDSLILSRFMDLKKAKSILDVGTNNAIIPAMIASSTSANIVGVEINSEAIAFANETLKLNNISNVEIINKDFSKYCDDIKPSKFDIIVSNPPYFEESKSRKIKENNELATARHDKQLSIKELIDNARTIINNNGLFYLVLRPERFSEVIVYLKEATFEPKRVMFCCPKKGREANLFVVEAKFQGNPGLKVLPELIVHNEDGSYSDALKEFIGG